MSGYSKKTGLLRKFKSGTSDKSYSKVEKSIKILIFNECDGYPYHSKRPQFLNFRRPVCFLAHFTELEMLPNKIYRSGDIGYNSRDFDDWERREDES